MKTATFGIVSFLITVFTIVAVLQVCNTHARSVNLQDNLQEAMETSLATAMDKNSYTIRNKDELVADVIEGVALYLDDNCELQMNVKEVDPVLGILSIELTAYYTPTIGVAANNGESSSVTVNRTVILEQYDLEMVGKHKVKYLITDVSGNSAIYKSYVFTEGQSIFVPKDPAKPGMRFLGWRYGGRTYTRAEIQALPLSKDYEFTAVFG